MLRQITNIDFTAEIFSISNKSNQWYSNSKCITLHRLYVLIRSLKNLLTQTHTKYEQIYYLFHQAHDSHLGGWQPVDLSITILDHTGDTGVSHVSEEVQLMQKQKGSSWECSKETPLCWFGGGDRWCCRIRSSSSCRRLLARLLEAAVPPLQLQSMSSREG